MPSHSAMLHIMLAAPVPLATTLVVANGTGRNGIWQTRSVLPSEHL